MDVFQEKQKIEAEKELLTAYMTAYFHRIDKLEPFEKYRSRLDVSKPEKKKMTDEEMLAKILNVNKLLNSDSD